MNKILVALLSSVCIGIVRAQIFTGGGCPNVQVQKTLDISRYMGDWYEIYKFYDAVESGQSCAKAHYELQPNGHVTIVNSAYKDGKNVTATGDAFIPDPVNNPAKLKLRFSTVAPYGNYWVIDTDYENYTFIYSCSSIVGVSHFEFAWILSRHKDLKDDVKQKLYNEAKAFGIDVTNFKVEDQTSCPYAN